MGATSEKIEGRGELKMQVQLAVIENLGLKMYATLPPVLSEMVANSWDADANSVEISIPDGAIGAESFIEIRDNGEGMAFSEINSTYLSIGRNRRETSKTSVTPKYERPVMGRKGIGKLSAFGVARIVEIETVSNGERTVFILDLDELLQTDAAIQYEPPYSLTKCPGEPTGTIVRLKNLSRKRRVNIEDIRMKVARRFSCLDTSFKVKINGSEINPLERNLKRQCQYKWEIDEKLSCSESESLHIKGWIGTTAEPVESQVGSGIVIMVRGKLAQEPTHFGVTGSWNNIANPYIVGEIHADFLDEDEDLIVTNRGSVVWDSEEGQVLHDWGRERVRSIATEWSKKRREQKEAIIRDDDAFKPWLARLSTSEKKVADKVIKTITGSNLPDERIKDLAGFMMESFDYQVFRDLVVTLEDSPEPDSAKLIEIFQEWGVIEAKEFERIAKGRITTIEQLEDHIIKNSREVPELHNFFADYPWILDPSWTIAHDEVAFSSLLRKEFPDESLDEANRRIDFVCLGAGDTIYVVELKRPKHKLGIDDFEQLEHYVAFIRSRLGNSGENRSYRGAAGYIVGGEVSEDYRVPDKIQRLERDRIYVRRYTDLLSVAKRLHSDFQALRFGEG